jgi:hypothetical protein
MKRREQKIERLGRKLFLALCAINDEAEQADRDEAYASAIRKLRFMGYSISADGIQQIKDNN